MAFDDFKKKLTAAADLAVDKAKDLAETGKQKMDIAAEEKELQNLYAQIGKSVYHLEKDNANIAERLQRIDELKKNPEAE